MTPGDRPEDWQLMVLAYADGELDPVSQIEVEAWIRTRPEVAELYRELREENRAFRDGTAPPDPDPLLLRRSGEVILARLRPRPYRPWLRPAILMGAAASMAGALFFACPPDHVCQVKVFPSVAPAPVQPADPLAEFDDLPIASAADARVSAVHGDVSPVFVSCPDLLPDVLDLATVDEMQIGRTGRSAFTVPKPGDAPMIYQTRAKAPEGMWPWAD